MDSVLSPPGYARRYPHKAMLKPFPVTLAVVVALVSACARNDTSTFSSSGANGRAAESQRATIQSESLVTLTDSAAAKFQGFLADFPGDHIRLSIKRDGPTGFTYDLQVESPPWGNDDIVDRSHGFVLVVAPQDSLYLDGATIDWETRADGTAGFKFHNPNAVDAGGG